MRFRSDTYLGLETDELFKRAVEDLVRPHLESPEWDWRKIIRELPGVYPTEVIRAIRRLLGDRALSGSFDNAICCKSTKATNLGIPVLSSFHIEHPLDFEWNFTNRGQLALLEKVASLAEGRKARVLCLGCPTLYSLGRAHDIGLEFLLWDKNASNVGQLQEASRLSNVDLLRDSANAELCEIAVLDPPWYNDFYKQFIWAALRALPINGKVVFVFPPAGTRPSAVADLECVVGWAIKAGAELISCEKGFLRYRSPLFERNALRAAGLHGVPLDWRTGDLIVLRKTDAREVDRPKTTIDESEWREVRIGPLRWKIRIQPSTGDEASLVPVASTAVLPSVSSRYPSRAGANVVTSGNRFLVSSDPVAVMEALEAIKTDEAMRMSLIASSLRSTLKRLLRVENAEFTNYMNLLEDNSG